jgi:hypothetical protein
MSLVGTCVILRDRAVLLVLSISLTKTLVISMLLVLMNRDIMFRTANIAPKL